MNIWLDKSKIKPINEHLRDRFSSHHFEDLEKLKEAIKWIDTTYGNEFLNKLRFYHMKWEVWGLKKNYWQTTLKGK